VTESDIALANRFDAIIYAFNTAVPAALAKAAEAASVPVRPFNVIYHLVDDLKQVGLLQIRIRIHRIHMFLVLLDPDPLVKGMVPVPDPGPDPSITKQR
jgi:hypothetical protein